MSIDRVGLGVIAYEDLIFAVSKLRRTYIKELRPNAFKRWCYMQKANTSMLTHYDAVDMLIYSRHYLSPVHNLKAIPLSL